MNTIDKRDITRFDIVFNHTGTVIAFDQDGEETLSFALKNHEDLFGFDKGNTLVTKTVLDYEYLPSYRIRVSVTDDGSPPAEVTHMIKSI